MIDTPEREAQYWREQADKLAEALTIAMEWIKGWDVGFLFDDEWPADEAKITQALAAFNAERLR